jgi:hypothetical protein
VSNDIIKYTTQELPDVTTRHALGEEASRAVFIPFDGKMTCSSSQVAPPKATSKGANGGKKEAKVMPSVGRSCYQLRQ